MKVIQVYDKPMCCSTGVCGPDVDPVLPKFAADLAWLQSQGHEVHRFNLAQQPQAFVESATVKSVLSTEGTESLPLILVDGEIVSRKIYPTRATMAGWTGDSATKPTLPMAAPDSGCCGETGCC